MEEFRRIQLELTLHGHASILPSCRLEVRGGEQSSSGEKEAGASPLRATHLAPRQRHGCRYGEGARRKARTSRSREEEALDGAGWRLAAPPGQESGERGRKERNRREDKKN
jgi:hypothetical protein